MGEWTAEDTDDGAFEKFLLGLPEYEQAVLVAAVEHVLERLGIDICQSEWGKALGDGLYEFRVRRSLQAILSEAKMPLPSKVGGTDRPVLLRVFCTFHGQRAVLLLGGYDKGKDGSTRRQQGEIKRARKRLKTWRANRKKR
ncbi:hypothetical protein [Demequina gelatinilytica]|uniref:hypothetical protein n=1 Tax=Demequina gelatinilytica TaxID=1638980 RepID=UPI000B14F71C|nr:hypothetical protein [Demequina gelatinilytica]